MKKLLTTIMVVFAIMLVVAIPLAQAKSTRPFLTTEASSTIAIQPVEVDAKVTIDAAVPTETPLFKGATYACYNGRSDKLTSTTCQTSAYWSEMATKACAAKSDCSLTKCGVNSFAVISPCGTKAIVTNTPIEKKEVLVEAREAKKIEPITVKSTSNTRVQSTTRAQLLFDQLKTEKDESKLKRNVLVLHNYASMSLTIAQNLQKAKGWQSVWPQLQEAEKLLMNAMPALEEAKKLAQDGQVQAAAEKASSVSSEVVKASSLISLRVKN